MALEQKYNSIILKKQEYGEADEIVTLFTLEMGKVRGLAKSSKSAKSKLSHGLQSLFVVEISLAGKGLQKIIGVEVLQTFHAIRQHLGATTRAFYALELTLKFTADEQKNEQLFHLLIAYLQCIDNNAESDRLVDIALAKFKIDFLDTLGVSVQNETINTVPQAVGFSNQRGGFVLREATADYNPVSSDTVQLFNILAQTPFADLKVLSSKISLEAGEESELQHVLSRFIVYQLEREVKSENLLHL